MKKYTKAVQPVPLFNMGGWGDALLNKSSVVSVYTRTYLTELLINSFMPCGP